MKLVAQCAAMAGRNAICVAGSGRNRNRRSSPVSRALLHDNWASRPAARRRLERQADQRARATREDSGAAAAKPRRRRSSASQFRRQLEGLSRDELQVVVAAMLLGMRVAAERPLGGAPARLGGPDGSATSRK